MSKTPLTTENDNRLKAIEDLVRTKIKTPIGSSIPGSSSVGFQLVPNLSLPISLDGVYQICYKDMISIPVAAGHAVHARVYLSTSETPGAEIIDEIPIGLFGQSATLINKSIDSFVLKFEPVLLEAGQTLYVHLGITGWTGGVTFTSFFRRDAINSSLTATRIANTLEEVSV